MSHRASAWLGDLPADRIGNGAFRVLFHLCNAHNNERDPELACFPSQGRLMELTGLSSSGLNKVLNELEEEGLIRRRRTRAPDGKQGPTYYILGCDRDLTAKPTPQSGDGADSTSGTTPTPLSAACRLHHGGEEPVIEPGIEPGNARRRSKKDQDSLFPEPPKRQPSDQDLANALSEAVPIQTARDFIRHRRAMKKPMTDVAVARLVKMLGDKAKFPDPVAALDEAMLKSWQAPVASTQRFSGSPSYPQQRPSEPGAAMTGIRGRVARIREQQAQEDRR